MTVEYGTTEQFLSRRKFLLENKPNCPICNKNKNVIIFIQIQPVSWECNECKHKWIQEP